MPFTFFAPEATEHHPFYLHNLPPFQGLIFFLSITRGCASLCDAPPPGYCSISASGA
jgi:hypothetical protein